MKTVKLVISGRVQGIGFRAHVKSFCDKIGLKGLVRNNNDGSVSIIAQAEEDKIRELIEFVKSNPGLTKVINIKKEDWGENEKYLDFKVDKEYSYLNDKKKSLNNLRKNL